LGGGGEGKGKNLEYEVSRMKWLTMGEEGVEKKGGREKKARRIV